jgi:hypothetical protein
VERSGSGFAVELSVFEVLRAVAGLCAGRLERAQCKSECNRSRILMKITVFMKIHDDRSRNSRKSRSFERQNRSV